MNKPAAHYYQLLSPTIVAIGLLALPRVFPALAVEVPPRVYLPLHVVLEAFSVGVSFGIFGVAWLQCSAQRNPHLNLLGAGFLAVGMIDLFHLLSYQGMPAFLTPSSPNKAILFWLAARIVTAATLLASGLVYPSPGPAAPATRRAAKVLFLVVPIAFSGGLLAVLSYCPGLLPVMYLPQTGLTSAKVGTEYGIVAGYGAAALLYFVKWRRTGGKLAFSLSGVLLLSIVSELAFTLYKSVTDTYNLLGHLYKGAAFGLLLRAFIVPLMAQVARRRGWFRRMQSQLVGAFMLSTLTGVGLVSGYGLHQYRESLHQRIRSDYSSRARLIAARIESLLQEVQTDLLMISRMPPIQGLLRAQEAGGYDREGGSSYGQWATLLERIMAAMMESTPAYAKVALWDDSGNELLRVARDGEAGRAALGSERSPVGQAMGQAYLSRARFLLGKSPVFEAYTPIFDTQGRRRGLMVLTVTFEIFLHIKSAQILEPGALLLVFDSRGNYIYQAGQPREQWGRPAWPDARDSLLTDFPEAAAVLLSGAAGDVDADFWHVFYRPILYDSDREGYLLLTLAVPQSMLDSPVNRLSWIYGGIMAISLLLAGGVSWQISRPLIRPLEALQLGVRQIEAAHWEQRVPVTGSQEIEELAASFNRMAEKLGMLFRGMQAQYQQLFENAGESIIVYDLEGKVLIANAKATRTLGYSHEELLSLTLGDIHTTEAAAQISSRMRLLKQHRTLRFVAEYVRKDGSRLPVEVHAALANYQDQQVVQSFVRDISIRRKTQKRARRLRLMLLRQKQHAETVLRSIADGVCTVDQERVISSWNRGAEQITGYTAREALGRPCAEFLKHRDDSGTILCDTERCLCRQAWAAQGSPVTEQVFLYHKEGRPVTVALSAGPIPSQGADSFGAVLVFRDVSKERELVRRLQEANRAKSDFLATVSHELRTPLNSIIGFAHLLLKKQHGELNVPQEEYVGFIRHGGEHLLSLINDILDLSKVESGKLQVHLVTCSMPMALDETLSLLEPQFAAKQISVLREVAPGLPPVRADALRLRQVFYNLLSNAVKFTPQLGRVTVKMHPVMAESGRLSGGPVLRNHPPQALKDGQWVLTLVEDTGIGIDPMDWERLFVPFQQLESPLSRQHQGTGLGLSLSRQLAEIQKGQLWLEWSQQAHGSVFAFLLPAAVQEKEQAR